MEKQKEQMDLESSNKLIAEFMKLKQVKWYSPISDKYTLVWVNENFMEDFTHVNDYSETSLFDWGNSLPQSEYLYYHSSWDWLMPVIRKIIKDIGVKTIDECTPEEWFQNTRICQMYIGIDIELAFYYVVEYIKWHNKNKLG